LKVRSNTVNAHCSCLVAKESLTRTPIVKQVMHSWGAIPVARDGNDSSALREVLRHPGVERVTLVDIDPAMTRLSY